MKKLIFAILVLELLLVGVMLLGSDLVHAQGPAVELENPILGVESLGAFVTKAFQGFASLIAIIAIAFTVFSGFKFVVATNEESVKSAKASITWSVGGFVIALLAFTLVSGVADVLGFQRGNIDVNQDDLNPFFLTGSQFQQLDFISVMNFVMINFLGLIGVATILMIIYYGYRYITAAGNEEAIAHAKSEIKRAIIGLIIVLLAFTIIQGTREIFTRFGG